MDLRILHLRTSGLLGGPERLLLAEASFRAPDVHPLLVSFGRRNRPHPFLDEARRLGLAAARIPQRGNYDPGALFRLRRLVAGYRPDLLVGHDYRANALLAAARGRRGPPIAVMLHGYTGENAKVRLYEAVDRARLKRADAVIAVSDAIRPAIEACAVPAGRVRVVANGIEAERVLEVARAAREEVRASWGVDPRTPVLLASGRMSPEKGHDLLLEAFRRLPPNGVPSPLLVFVGDGVLRRDLEARARRLAHGAVRFEGWRSDPWRFLGGADLFVLPSRREGLPLSLLEGMAAGLPIVASRVGGVPEALAEGEAGVLVPPDDPEALALACKRLLADPARRAALGASAAERSRTRYGVERHVRELEAVYRELVGP